MKTNLIALMSYKQMRAAVNEITTLGMSKIRKMNREELSEHLILLSNKELKAILNEKEE